MRKSLGVLLIAIAGILVPSLLFSQAKVTLHSIGLGEGWLTNLEKRIPEFKKLTGIDVVIEKAQYYDVHTKIVLDLTQKKAKPDYDFYFMDIPWKAEFVTTDQLLDLTKLASPSYHLEDLDKTYLTAVGGWKGKIYAYPILSVTRFIYYRKDLFENPAIKAQFQAKTGRELRVPTTWEEYNDTARFFTKSLNPDSPIAYGSVISAQKGSRALIEYDDRLFGLGGTEFLYNEKDDSWTAAVNSNVSKKALQVYLDLKSSAPEGSENADWDLSVRTFISGDAAMMIMWDAFAGLVMDPKESKVWNKVGFSPAPNGGAATMGGWGLCINKNSPRAKEAYKFLEWATGPDNARKMTLDGPGAIPRKTVYNDPKIQAKQPWIVAQAGAIAVARGRSEAYRGGPTLIPEPEYEMILGTAVNAAYAGLGDPGELLDKANSDLNAMLEERGYKVSQ